MDHVHLVPTVYGVFEDSHHVCQVCCYLVSLKTLCHLGLSSLYYLVRALYTSLLVVWYLLVC